MPRQSGHAPRATLRTGSRTPPHPSGATEGAGRASGEGPTLYGRRSEDGTRRGDRLHGAISQGGRAPAHRGVRAGPARGAGAPSRAPAARRDAGERLPAVDRRNPESHPAPRPDAGRPRRRGPRGHAHSAGSLPVRANDWGARAPRGSRGCPRVGRERRLHRGRAARALVAPERGGRPARAPAPLARHHRAPGGPAHGPTPRREPPRVRLDRRRGRPLGDPRRGSAQTPSWP
jgi:hypothetical protein